MKDFDYIIIGGGCAGLSLAYELQIHNKLINKTLAIIEPRPEYKKDRVIDERIAYLMQNNLEELITRGSAGRRSSALNRKPPLADMNAVNALPL